jgi:hypothetical protein
LKANISRILTKEDLKRGHEEKLYYQEYIEGYLLAKEAELKDL